MYKTLAEDQLAEVLVRSYQDGTPHVCLLEDFLIWNAGRQVGHVDERPG